MPYTPNPAVSALDQAAELIQHAEVAIRMLPKDQPFHLFEALNGIARLTDALARCARQHYATVNHGPWRTGDHAEAFQRLREVARDHQQRLREDAGAIAYRANEISDLCRRTPSNSDPY